MSEIRTTLRLSCIRNRLSLNMNQTATLGGAPRPSNALHQRRAEITTGLASFRASLALSGVVEGKASAVSFAKLATL